MLSCLFSLLISYAFAGDMYAYPVQKIPLGGIREIRITGVNGKLGLRGRGRNSSLNLRVSHSKNHKYDDWQLQVERRGSILFLEVFDVAFGKAFNKQVQQDVYPEFDIDIEGPSLPITVAWREGQLRFKDWQSKIDLSFLSGSAKIDGGAGNLNLQPVTADISLDHHVGDVNLNGRAGHVELTHGQGALNLTWLSGQIHMDKWQGKVTVDAQSVGLTASGLAGTFDAKIETGSAKISNSTAALKISGGSCAWDIQAEAPNNLNIASHNGPVSLKWKGGGHVFLASQRGPVDILHSDFLATVKKDGSRVAEGRKIEKKMGQVFVKTDSGPIRWRQ